MIKVMIETTFGRRVGGGNSCAQQGVCSLNADDVFVVVVVDFYIALFSHLELADCADIACDSEQVTVSFNTNSTLTVVF